MQVRDATDADAAAIRAVAQTSLRASYSLSPAAIESAIDRWYSDGALVEKLGDPQVIMLVAEDDGRVVAFSDSVLVGDRGDILWLHVDPTYRGEGIGAELFESTCDQLEAEDAEDIRGLVLDDNVEGNEFYERQGLVKAGEDTVEIDGESYVENIYVQGKPQELEPVTYKRRQLYVDVSDSDRGSDGPFHVVYSDTSRENKWGYYCGNCETPVTSMDAMGRMECGNCGNKRKPTRWDAAYM